MWDGSVAVSEQVSVPVWWGGTFPLESNMRGKSGWWMEMPLRNEHFRLLGH